MLTESIFYHTMSTEILEKKTSIAAKYLPKDSQLIPFPVYSILQLHLKEPSILEHIAKSWQL